MTPLVATTPATHLVHVALELLAQPLLNQFVLAMVGDIKVMTQRVAITPATQQALVVLEKRVRFSPNRVV